MATIGDIVTINAETRRMARRPKWVWPYAGHSEDSPDPAPEFVEIKRRDRLRMIAPALIGSLITGQILPAPQPRNDIVPTKPRILTKRDANRLRKQRQRDRERDARRIAAEAEAEFLEARGERLAPAAMRHSVSTAGGAMIIGARVQIVDGRPERAFALHTVNNPSELLALKPREEQAARQLQNDWNDVGSGINVGAVDYLRGNGGGGIRYPDEDKAMLDQIKARGRLDGAMTHLGAFAPSIARVLLDCVPLTIWGPEVGKTSEEARAWILAGLNRLIGFYWPPTPHGQSGPVLLTFGPSR
jgi:hypothetical protein